ncbi:bifunctional 4-hydroxy-2-oxoglutarate aldolase/2-dehydro-3-deoxy-phosphogluconate aldolase [Maribacter sp. 2210JD10-5]|uniref:bifunctional 4-hydroxy-2-oxoglutarate aldolase/2-dehydro-3-deoxy-phosphogluconate aldolase n=1 Tax=Maribacter sp. 2210JD10-5 TaxID=3386272 RepID=UPI0039BD7475
MKKETILDKIGKEKLVVVIRLSEQKYIPEVIKALVTGGVKVLEITSNTPGFLEEIKNARIAYPDILVGAGTVINAKIAKDAIEAGAQFIVTPNTNPEVVKVSHDNNVPVLMGALTPTEVCNAVAAGADVVKLFPIANMGVKYFKAIKGPLSNVAFFAVGGISLENIQEWKEAGVSGFGLGGNLVKPIHNQQNFESIVSLAKEVIKTIHK